MMPHKIKIREGFREEKTASPTFIDIKPHKENKIFYK